MEVMIGGYGTGAFETLRCKFNPVATAAEIDPSAVSMSAGYAGGRRRKLPGLVLTGETMKVGDGAQNNDVRLILHGMTAAEAVVLARKVLEYASYLQETEVAEAGA